jgi:hypothetical protein
VNSGNRGHRQQIDRHYDAPPVPVFPRTRRVHAVFRSRYVAEAQTIPVWRGGIDPPEFFCNDLAPTSWSRAKVHYRADVFLGEEGTPGGVELEKLKGGAGTVVAERCITLFDVRVARLSGEPRTRCRTKLFVEDWRWMEDHVEEPCEVFRFVQTRLRLMLTQSLGQTVVQ